MTDSVEINNQEINNEDKDKDVITTRFDSVISTLTTFRTQITTLQKEIRSLEKIVKNDRNKSLKEYKKNKNYGNRKPSGFAMPIKISDELCKFMKKDEGTEVARTEVTQYIIKYITDNKLQNPNDRRIIVPDESLCKLLDVKDDEEINYFNIQKYMNKHFQSNINDNNTITQS